MKKRLLSLLLAVSMLVAMLSATAYADTMPFTDLVENAWYTTAVQYVYDNGIMNGQSTTTFAPDANLTRAETCQILYNYEGQPGYTGDAFTDVSSN